MTDAIVGDLLDLPVGVKCATEFVSPPSLCAQPRTALADFLPSFARATYRHSLEGRLELLEWELWRELG